MKDTNKLINNILRALPAIPFLAPKKKPSIVPYILGAVGVAIAGGIAAVMFFSPRTRNRTLDIAKEGYGKVRGQLGHLGRSHGEAATTSAYSNRLAPENTGMSQSNNPSM